MLLVGTATHINNRSLSSEAFVARAIAAGFQVMVVKACRLDGQSVHGVCAEDLVRRRLGFGERNLTDLIHGLIRSST